MSASRIIQAQATLFTRDFQFRNARVLSHFLEKRPKLFDGEPNLLDLPEVMPSTVPRVILKSEDGLLNLLASPAQIAFTCSKSDNTASVGLNEHFVLAAELFVEYLAGMKASSGRVAALATRVTPDKEPARTLSRHFCRDQWLQGPINRPSEFELHSMKQYLFDHTFEVNSWIRCKSGSVEITGQDAQRVIVIEQDINTLFEQTDAKEFTPTDIRAFYSSVATELDAIFRYYFPLEGD